MHGMALCRSLDIRWHWLHWSIDSRLVVWIWNFEIRFFHILCKKKKQKTKRHWCSILDYCSWSSWRYSRYRWNWYKTQFIYFIRLFELSQYTKKKKKIALGATVLINGARRVVQIIDNHDGTYGARYAVPSDATVRITWSINLIGLRLIDFVEGYCNARVDDWWRFIDACATIGDLVDCNSERRCSCRYELGTSKRKILI